MRGVSLVMAKNLTNIFFGFFSLALVSFSSVAVEAQERAIPLKGRIIQIILEKGSDGGLRGKLIDTKGEKVDFTLAALIDAAANSWADKYAEATSPELSPNLIALIQITRTGNHLQVSLYDTKGKELSLDLGNLLAAAAVSYPGCKNLSSSQLHGASVNLKVVLEKNKEGDLETYLQTSSGKEKFDFAALIKATTLILNQCQNQ